MTEEQYLEQVKKVKRWEELSDQKACVETALNRVRQPCQTHNRPITTDPFSSTDERDVLGLTIRFGPSESDPNGMEVFIPPLYLRGWQLGQWLNFALSQKLNGVETEMSNL